MSLLSAIPKPLHRALYRLAFTVRSVLVRTFNAELTGCSIVALDEQRRILLVRHSYGTPQWTVPGGGMRKGEDPVRTALREIAEELDCSLHEPRFLTRLQEPYYGGSNQVHVVVGQVKGAPRPDMREIVEVGFFHRHELPHDTAPMVSRRLALLIWDEE